MTHWNRLRRLLGATALGFLVGWTGCAADKLTQNQFRQIKVHSTTQTEVQSLIGEPTNKLDGLWLYERPDKHLTAFVDFDADGKVARVQWVDAKGEVWEDSADQKRVAVKRTGCLPRNLPGRSRLKVAV